MTKWNHGALSFSRCRRPSGEGRCSHRFDFFEQRCAVISRGAPQSFPALTGGLSGRSPATACEGASRGRDDVAPTRACVLIQNLNYYDALRHDELVQPSFERDAALASASTLCRFGRRAEPRWKAAIHQVVVENFITSHRRAPRELVIDLDATDDPVHGHQPGRFFHGYYNWCCFLPLYAFCSR